MFFAKLEKEVKPLADPVLDLYRGSTHILHNDDWWRAPEAGRMAAIAAAQYSFPLTPSGGDAALLVYLPPGEYTAIISGAGGTEGVALAEVYRVVE